MSAYGGTGPVVYDPTTLPADDNVNPYTFCVDLKGSQWFLQKGKMIAYYGAIEFNGIGHGGHHVQVIDLTGDTLYVEADRLLAFEGTLQQGTMFMGSQGGVMGMVRGQVTGQGLFTTTLKGHGSVAVMAHGGVFEVPITPGRAVHVDPQAYVAHYGDVRNKLSTALGWRDMVGRGSGEAFQLELSGNGMVYVQASEEKL